MATKLTSILINTIFLLSLYSTSEAWDNSPTECPYPCFPPPTSIDCPPPPAEPISDYPPPPPPGSGYFNPPPIQTPGYFPYNPPPYVSFPAPPPPNPILPWFPWHYMTSPPPTSSAAANPSLKADHSSLLFMVLLSMAVGFLVF